MKYLFYIVVLMATLSSCVTNKKIAYVQKNDLHKRKLPKDTVVRSYQLPKYEYKIQPEDLLSVQFRSLTEEKYNFFSQQSMEGGGTTNQNMMLRGQLVDYNGEIEFLEVGKVKVAGLSVFKAQDTLQNIANKYLDGSVVNVRLLNYRFTVLGEENQGVYNITNNRITIFEALGMAGMSELSNRKDIKIIRQQGDSTEVAYINVLDEDLLASPYYYIHQNDVLVVPPLRQRPYRKYFAQNWAIIASTAATVLITLNLILGQ